MNSSNIIVANLSKHDLAVRDLKMLINSSLQSKLEELKAALAGKMNAQEESFNQKLKKLDEEEKKKLADAKAKPKK